MIIPGPKATCILQEATESRTSTGGVTNAYSDIHSFKASLAPLSANEINAFARETVISSHRMMVGYEQIGNAQAANLKEKNRIHVPNAENQLLSETFDITGVDPYRFPGNIVATFEVMLRKVE